MPVIILFLSLIVASLIGIVLSTFFSVNGVAPDWIHQVFLAMIATGVITTALTKENVCQLCSLVAIKKLSLCQCQHA